MSENLLKGLAVLFIVIALWGIFRSPRKQPDQYNVNVTSIAPAADGLDLRALGGLVKKARDAEQFERLLNDSKEGINNLDLDQDGNVDYIKVTEYGNEQARGFSLTAEPAVGEEQEVATIEVEKLADGQAQVEVHGSSQIYGHNHYYHSRFSLTDALLLGYLFRPHSLYASPWHYGHYPSYYSSYPQRPVGEYRQTAGRAAGSWNGQRASSSTLRNTVTSPNQGKTAKSIKAPLRNPTASQKQFQARQTKSVRSGGFGKSSRSSATPSRPSVRRSSYSRSGSRSGGK